ncbi:unnamed protein product [Nippostrongylus brasiliensis]|uniref:LIM domain only protein 7 n=1 Tax=Nippostrongylus brasiliensis TaxID=27835 RepID=A0A0N4Y7M6_NIPBR|nr:unnamed protein product [Nippostrongylus brasiliensis]
MRNDEAEERPVVVEQAQRATPTPTSSLASGYRRKKRETKYGSYRTLNDDAYCSDMDDLCDPDFYLNYTSPITNNHSTAPKPPDRTVSEPQQQRYHAGARSMQLPRKTYQPVEAFTDRRLFAEDYDAVSEARDPDDWLTHKLRKVKSKRELDPDQMRRRTQERMLLEELKNARDDKELLRGGVGTRDPLAEYRREEERLRNTNSPFEDMPRWSYTYRNHNGYHEPNSHDFSNLNSIVHGNNGSYQPKAEQHIPNGHLPSTTSTNTTSSMGIRRENRGMSQHEPRSESRQTLQRRQSFGTERPPFQYADATLPRNPNEPAKFISGQERVAAAIYRAETPHRDMYSSGTIHRSETPNRYFPENSTTLPYARSETPAFPIMRETPLPFHPLLYGQNGSSRQDLDQMNIINYRCLSVVMHPMSPIKRCRRCLGRFIPGELRQQRNNVKSS